MLPKVRSARFVRVAKKLTGANATNALLVAAPASGLRVVLDYIYFTTSVAGTVEIFNNVTGWTDADGLMGATLAANQVLSGIVNIEGADGQAVSYTTTGTTPNSYIVVVYHFETA